MLEIYRLSRGSNVYWHLKSVVFSNALSTHFSQKSGTILYPILQKYRLNIVTKHYELYTRHYTVYATHYTLYTVYYTLHTVHYTLYTIHCTLHTVQYTLYTTLHTVHYRLYTTLHYKVLFQIVSPVYKNPTTKYSNPLYTAALDEH